MELIAYDPEEQNYSPYCQCGNSTAALLTDVGIQIALCEECLADLLLSVSEFQSIIFCKDCKYFEKSISGSSTVGRCKLNSENCTHYFMHTCMNADKK